MKKTSLGLILILLVSIVGVTVYYQGQISNLNKELDALQESLNDKEELENDYSNVKNDLNELNRTYNDLLENYKDLQENHSKLQSDYTLTKENLENVKDNLNQLKKTNNELNQEIKNLKNGSTYYKPSLSSVNEFLKENDVDEREYKDEDYTCVDYTFDLMEAGKKEGFETGFVYIYLYSDNSNSAHSIAYFNTSDEGVVYVEPQTDTMLYELPKDEYYWKLVYEKENLQYNEEYKFKISQVKISP